MVHHTWRDGTMPKTKVALTLDAQLLDRVDELVAKQRFRNRSQAGAATDTSKVVTNPRISA